MTKKFEQAVYDYVPRHGRYICDIHHQFEKRAGPDDIRAALYILTLGGYIKRAGCDVRPMYVRLINPKIFYATYAPVMPAQPLKHPTMETANAE